MTRVQQDATLFPSIDGETPIEPPRPVAVIDLGTSSIRMAVGEIRSDGEFKTLETLSQAVALGKDAFTRGNISRQTIEDCVHTLSMYREVLRSYGIDRDEQLRCVATSAVREAQNRLAFVDRVYIATGIQVEILDAAEVSRVTYLGVEPTLSSDPALFDSRAIVIEVGGGTTELLVVEKGQVLFSHSYNLGSLRLRQTLAALRAPADKEREIMENHIDRVLDQAMQAIGDTSQVTVELIALGGDFRFAAAQLLPEHVEDSLYTLATEVLAIFVDETFSSSIDELVRDHHLSFPDAETLGPALLAVLRLARRLNVPGVRISNMNLRDGLLQEFAGQGMWRDEFSQQVINSAIDLGRKYTFDETHARHVAHLSSLLFDGLQNQHRLEGRFRLVLQLAALLHEIGLFVSISSYHKHSMYLIQHSELFGLSRRDLMLVSMVARYHRRASPRPTHAQFSNLSREDRVVISKLASLLRVAIALDRSYSQRIREIDCSIEKDRFIVTISGVYELSLEQIALRQTVQLFEETYGMSVLLRCSRI
jgi:exopolyphosphatase / guanosine-5'-triphosphate,3'-diphosphate pyrophosphatase